MKRPSDILQVTFLIIVLMLSACAPVTPAVVEERIVTGVKQETDAIGGAVIRFAQPGDTLYAIAFDNGLDARDLAAWNGLSLDNRINVGQKLRLTKPLNFVAKAPPSRAPVTAPSDIPVNVPTNPSANIPLDNSQTVGGRTGNPVQAARPIASNRAVGQPVPQSVAQWQWPIAGKLLRGFELSNGQQGIDIEGVPGQSVMASAAGEVVYAGNGLKGYGNLIIIKHDEEFLSAYAHNEAVFVKEGERVKQASIIASMGTNQRGEPALQFQIRKRGSPVDPLSYLPRF